MKEFGTIKICAARQSGHTYAIKKFLGNRKIGEQWLVLFPNFRMESFFKKVPLYMGKLNITGTFNTIKNCERMKKMSFNGIIIDCASFLSKGEAELIYDNFYFNLIDKKGVIIFME